MVPGGRQRGRKRWRGGGREYAKRESILNIATSWSEANMCGCKIALRKIWSCSGKELSWRPPKVIDENRFLKTTRISFWGGLFYMVIGRINFRFEWESALFVRILIFNFLGNTYIFKNVIEDIFFKPL